MYFVEAILRKSVVPRELVDLFLQRRRMLKENRLSKKNRDAYRAVKKQVTPKLISAKDVLLKKIHQHELENIKKLGFIMATEGTAEDPI